MIAEPDEVEQQVGFSKRKGVVEAMAPSTNELTDEIEAILCKLRFSSTQGGQVDHVRTWYLTRVDPSIAANFCLSQVEATQEVMGGTGNERLERTKLKNSRRLHMTAADHDRQSLKSLRSKHKKKPFQTARIERGIYSWGSWLRRVFSASRFS